MGLERIFWLGSVNLSLTTKYGVRCTVYSGVSAEGVWGESLWVKAMLYDLPDWRVVGERSGAQCRSQEQFEARIDCED